jgi:membrane-bound metal-dependent hydrolase YbcI (DUF457 family)
MPVTLYHFGPSGFFALLFRKWIDIPVFLLANVIVDIEVLFAKNWLQHRYWHWHTFLIGAVVGLAWAVAAYPLKNLFKKIMEVLRIPYQTSLRKMIISGVLGVWAHVVVDGIYHYDVQPFWPYKLNPLWRALECNVTQGQIKVMCVVFMVVALMIYISIARSYSKQLKAKKLLDSRD